jgi:hypothetical protein
MKVKYIKLKRGKVSKCLTLNNEYFVYKNEEGFHILEDGVVVLDNYNDVRFIPNECFVFTETKDSVVESVLSAFKRRSERGIDKYGVTLDRTDLSTLEWLKHLQEELMDATLYIERLKQEFNNK